MKKISDFKIHVGMSREDQIIEFKWITIVEVSLVLCVDHEVILCFAIFDLGVLLEILAYTDSCPQDILKVRQPSSLVYRPSHGVLPT